METGVVSLSNPGLHPRDAQTHTSKSPVDLKEGNPCTKQGFTSCEHKGEQGLQCMWTGQDEPLEHGGVSSRAEQQPGSHPPTPPAPGEPFASTQFEATISPHLPDHNTAQELSTHHTESPKGLQMPSLEHGRNAARWGCLALGMLSPSTAVCGAQCHGCTPHPHPAPSAIPWGHRTQEGAEHGAHCINQTVPRERGVQGWVRTSRAGWGAQCSRCCQTGPGCSSSCQPGWRRIRARHIPPSSPPE